MASRRLVARNGFRNTTNAFDGVHLQVAREGAWRVRGFWTRPVVLDPSYFENESSERTLPGRTDGVLEDNLFIQLRGLRGDYLPPGGSREVAFLPSAFQRRLRHRPLAWTTAEIERLAEPETVTVALTGASPWFTT